MAPPLKYKSADELDAAIDRYFLDRRDNADTLGYPTWANMQVVLKISDDTLLRYRTKQANSKNTYEGYAEVIKKAEKLHCDFWQQFALAHPNLQTFCIFELKQPHNGGFVDRQQVEQSGKVTLDVSINGSDKAFD